MDFWEFRQYLLSIFTTLLVAIFMNLPATVTFATTSATVDFATKQEEALPELKIKNPKVIFQNGIFEVSFDLLLEGSPEKVQDIEVKFYTSRSEIVHTVTLEGSRGTYKINLQDEPLRMIVDEGQKIRRRLAQKEIAPTISALFNENALAVIIENSNNDLFEPLIENLQKLVTKVTVIETPDYKGLSTLGHIISDSDTPSVKRLFGSLNIIDADFYITVKKNPWKPDQLIGIIHAKNKQHLQIAFDLITTQMKELASFSTIAIESGRIILKERSEPQPGIAVELRMPAKVVEPQKVTTIKDVISAIHHKKIIYLGEYHDRFSHHYTQLQFIKELYAKNKKIAIGMEMFQRPFQQILDDYINKKIEEKDFLKKTEYFKRWGFDYNLYKPIIDFARENSIPVIALNLRKEIIEKVSQKGIDSLSEEEKMEIPEELDFSDDTYMERLKEVFLQHKRSNAKFEYFYQSQILWDETMAMSIDDFLKKNPDYQIIVLAGGGHIAYGSGIPTRAFRRNRMDYAIVLIDAVLEKAIADYIIYPEPLEGILAPKLGLSLKEDNAHLMVIDLPKESPSKNAGIKKGDIIIKIDDQPVSTLEDLKVLLFYKKAGNPIKVTVLRQHFLFGERDRDFTVVP